MAGIWLSEVTGLSMIPPAVRIVSDDFQTALLGYDHKTVPLLNAREVRIEMSDKHVRFSRYLRYSYLKRLKNLY